MAKSGVLGGFGCPQCRKGGISGAHLEGSRGVPEGPKFRVWAHGGVSPTGPRLMGRHVEKGSNFGSPKGAILEVKSGHFGGSKKWQNPKKRHFWHFWALLAKTRILTEKKGQKSRKKPLFSTGNSVSRPRARNALFGSPSRVSWGEKTPPGTPGNAHRVRKRRLQVPYLRGGQKSEKSRNFAQVSYPPNSPRSLYTLSDFNSGL